MKHLLISILLFFIILAACERPINPPYSRKSVYNCDKNLSLDSLAKSNALIGQWKWEFTQCFWTYEDANGEDFKGLTIEFKKDGTLKVRENSNTVQTSNWFLDEIGSSFFKLKAEPPVEQLYGAVTLCKNRVVFSGSDADGCDNYFSKIN